MMHRLLPVLFLAFLIGSCQPASDSYDLLLVNGTIVDGTGNPWYHGDVGIRDGKVVATGTLSRDHARQVVDVGGNVIAPGFIDMLGQSEYGILVDNRALNKISQGITTEINGEGTSAAPLNDTILNEERSFFERRNLKPDWTDYAGYFRRVEAHKSAINLASYVGATQVREYVLGYGDIQPTPEQLDKMKQLVAQAMKQGALGVSTALEYAPALYSKTDELIELAKAAAQYGGIYVSHIRNEDDHLMQAILEAADIGRAAKIPVEIWHLKASEKPNWGMMVKVVQTIQQLRSQGVDITADVYPYIAYGNNLSAELPGWAREGGTAELLHRLADSATRKRIISELDSIDRAKGIDYQSMMIASTSNPDLKQFEGKRITDVAKTWKKRPSEAMVDFVLADSARTGRVVFAMNENDLTMAMAQPWVSFCTDAGVRALDNASRNGKPHPRGFGSFPRILRKYVHEENVMSLEEAIRKMTSLPAQRVGLRDRGLVKPGFYADLVVFNPDSVRDVATFEDPWHYSEGMNLVIVNGQPVWEHGAFTGNLPGMVLRGPGYRP